MLFLMLNQQCQSSEGNSTEGNRKSLKMKISKKNNITSRTQNLKTRFKNLKKLTKAQQLCHTDRNVSLTTDCLCRLFPVYRVYVVHVDILTTRFAFWSSCVFVSSTDRRSTILKLACGVAIYNQRLRWRLAYMLSLYAFTACESGVGHGHADHSSWRTAAHWFYRPHGFSTVEINVCTVTRVRKHHSYNSTVLTLVKLTGLAVRTAVHSVLWHFWVARTFGHCRWLSGCNHWNGFYAHLDMGSDELRDWETQPEEIVPLVAIVTKFRCKNWQMCKCTTCRVPAKMSG